MARARRKKPPTLAPDTYELADDYKESQADIDRKWLGHPDNAFVYDPQERHLLPEAGAWVMVIRELPPIEGGFRERVRPGCFFYAVRSSTNTDKAGFGPDGTYKALLHTVWGDVWLFPYEYATVPTDDILSMWQHGELVFHPTDVALAEFNDQVFYARSRGIPLGEAAAMALGTVEANVGWFEPHEDLLSALAEMAKRVGGPLTSINHERRAAARSRRA